MTSSLPPSVLRSAALSSGTSSQYRLAASRFVLWAKSNSFQASSPDQLDGVLAQYIDWLFLNGRSKQAAACAFYSVLHFMPHCKSRMFECSLRLRGWNRLQPSRSYPPMLWEIAVVVALSFIKQGDVDAGLATLLAFDAYLRVNEFCKLRISDVACAGDARLGSSPIATRMSLRLRETKTGKNQFVQVKRHAVSALIACHVSGRAPDELVFHGLSASEFRLRLRQVLTQLSLGDVGYVPHSLRHGSAVLDLLHGDSIQDVMYRGRWRRVESARIYLQSGRALLLSVNLPVDLVELGNRLSQDLVLAVSLLQFRQHAL